MTRQEEWEKLKALEPELSRLETEIRAVDKPLAQTGRIFCANAWWYGYGAGRRQGFKSRLLKLVGWDARDERLRSSHAYDVAYDYLYDLLPDCEPGCGCG